MEFVLSRRLSAAKALIMVSLFYLFFNELLNPLWSLFDLDLAN